MKVSNWIPFDTKVNLVGIYMMLCTFKVFATSEPGKPCYETINTNALIQEDEHWLCIQIFGVERVKLTNSP